METYIINTILALMLLSIHWILAMLAQTIMLHRWAAHSQFKFTNKFWEHTARFVTTIILGPSFLTFRGYAIMHRNHHEHAETNKDSHSPKIATDPKNEPIDYKNADDNIHRYDHWWEWVTRGFFGYLNHTRKAYALANQEEMILEADGTIREPEPKTMINLPKKTWLDHLMSNRFVRLVWIVLYSYLYIIYMELSIVLTVFFVAGHATMAPMHGWIVNMLCHTFGHRNFIIEDSSRNLTIKIDPEWSKTKQAYMRVLKFTWDIFMCGEHLHNNHHPNPSEANFEVEEDEVDFGWKVIKGFDIINIIQLPRARREYKNTPERTAYLQKKVG